MAYSAYIGVSGKARKIKNIYIGVNGKARLVTRGYVGVGGKARKFWSNGEARFLKQDTDNYYAAQTDMLGKWNRVYMYGSHKRGTMGGYYDTKRELKVYYDNSCTRHDMPFNNQGVAYTLNTWIQQTTNKVVRCNYITSENIQGLDSSGTVTSNSVNPRQYDSSATAAYWLNVASTGSIAITGLIQWTNGTVFYENLEVLAIHDNLTYTRISSPMQNKDDSFMTPYNYYYGETDYGTYYHLGYVTFNNEAMNFTAEVSYRTRGKTAFQLRRINNSLTKTCTYLSTGAASYLAGSNDCAGMTGTTNKYIISLDCSNYVGSPTLPNRYAVDTNLTMSISTFPYDRYGYFAQNNSQVNNPNSLNLGDRVIFLPSRMDKNQYPAISIDNSLTVTALNSDLNIGYCGKMAHTNDFVFLRGLYYKNGTLQNSEDTGLVKIYAI